MAPRETENNDKQRALWYVMVFSGAVNRKFLTPTLTGESTFHIGCPVLRAYDHVSTKKFIVCSN